MEHHLLLDRIGSETILRRKKVSGRNLAKGCFQGEGCLNNGRRRIEEEDDDIEFDLDAYENEEGKENFNKEQLCARTEKQKRNRLFAPPQPKAPRRLPRAPLSSKRKKKKNQTNNASPKL